MFDKWIMTFLLSFVLRQLEKFQKSTDWNKVKADLKPRIEAIVPGKWFDAEAVAACFAIVDVVAAALSNSEDIEAILKLCAAEKWAEALVALRDLVLGAWSPVGARQVAFAAELKLVA